MDWSGLVTASVGLVGVLIGSLITVHFQSKDRAERLAHETRLEGERRQLWIDQQWWQRKADTYSQIVGALRNLLNEYEHRVASEMGETSELTPEVDATYKAESAKYWQVISSAADIGEFVVSSEVSNALRKWSKDVEDNGNFIAPNWFDYFDACVHDTKSCLETVRIAALRDLGVAQHSFQD
jgi:hypothetical protein